MVKIRRKTSLEFDTEKRKDFLTGFRKRKDARKKQARAQIDQQLKEEKARIKNDKKDAVQKRLVEIYNIKMNNDMVETSCVDGNATTIDLPNHTVTVVESDLFDPVTSIFMGENEEIESKEEKASDDKPTKKFNARRTAESVSKLSKTKQKLDSKKKKMPAQRASKQTKKFLKKKQHMKGIQK